MHSKMQTQNYVLLDYETDGKVGNYLQKYHIFM